MNLKKEKYTEKENINGVLVVSTRDHSSKITCMALANSRGLMVRLTKENMRMMLKMASEFLHGLAAKDTKDNGDSANKMDKERCRRGGVEN